MNKFSFDAATHTYRYGGEIIPSVTQIMAPLFDFSSVPAATLEASRQWGTAVHEMIRLWIADDLDEGNLDPALKTVLSGFEVWTNGPIYKHAPLQGWIVEAPLSHPKLKYAGTPDIIIDGIAIIDIKTRKPSKADSIQLAAYDRLHLENGGTPADYMHIVLYLDTEGNYREKAVNDKQAWPMFRYLLDHHRHMQEFNEKIRRLKSE